MEGGLNLAVRWTCVHFDSWIFWNSNNRHQNASSKHRLLWLSSIVTQTATPSKHASNGCQVKIYSIFDSGMFEFLRKKAKMFTLLATFKTWMCQFFSIEWIFRLFFPISVDIMNTMIFDTWHLQIHNQKWSWKKAVETKIERKKNCVVPINSFRREKQVTTTTVSKHN